MPTTRARAAAPLSPRGKYITNNIYIEVITDARGFTATQLEVSLTKALSVLSQAGSFGGSNVTVRYKKDF